MRSLALALAGIALARPVCSMKEKLDIEEDYRRIIVIDNFGFHKKGQISLKMKDLQVSQLRGVHQEFGGRVQRTYGRPHLPAVA